MRSEVAKLLLVAAVAAALTGCGKKKSGAGDADDMGTHASMVIDGNGVLHASYYWRNHKVSANRDEKVGALMYVKGKVGSDGFVHWGDPQRVDGDVRIDGQSNVGQYTSIKLGADGKPRIAYYDLQNGDLKYASLETGKWVTEAVDAAGNVGGYASLVVEGNEPRIAYYDFDAKNLKFASHAASGWSKSVVDDGNGGQWDVGRWCSLAADGNGGLGIAYYDATNGDLGYIVGAASGFPAAASATEWVDTDGDTGRWPKLGYDLGSPRIAFQDYTNQHLRFAKKDGAGSWAVDTIDSAPWTGADTSIAIDPTGKVTVAYFDGLNNDVLSARWDGSTWSLGKVAEEGANGYFNNVVLDGTGAPIYGWYTYSATSFVAERVTQ